MRLIWEHAAEEWDPFTILGAVELHGDCGNTISDDCITLDSWLVAFAQALLKLRAGKLNAVVDTIHEPIPIDLRVQGTECLLQWGSRRASIGTLETACQILGTELQSLADDLVMRSPPRDEVAISELIANAKLLANNCVNRSGESGPN